MRSSGTTNTSSFDSTSNPDANLMKFMSAAPQGSNAVQGFAATGMVPQYATASNMGLFSSMGMVPNQMVQTERSGDINVMRG